jgi:ribonuclease Z
VTELTFLGTGNFVAPPGRYWNSFVMDASVLVEPSPTALPHLRRCGFGVDAIEVIVVSHFHADHCFGWPFLLQAAAELGGGRTVHVVGPPGLEAHLRFRAVEVVHVPYLRCFGYLFERAGQVIAYSGDTTPCEGLSDLAREADVLVVECNGRHTGSPGVPPSHMDEESIRQLRGAHPDLHLVLTHLGEQVDTTSMPGVTIPDDFERLTV